MCTDELEWGYHAGLHGPLTHRFDMLSSGQNIAKVKEMTSTARYRMTFFQTRCGSRETMSVDNGWSVSSPE